MKCSYGVVSSYSSKEKWPVCYLNCNNTLISLGKKPDVSTLLATFMLVFHKIMLFLSYTLSGKCVCFFSLQLIFHKMHIFTFIISSPCTAGGWVSKSANQYLSCGNHCQLSILLDFILAGVLQMNT